MKKTILLLQLFLFLSTIYSFSQNFTQKNKIVASDREIFDYFGSNVSVSGNYAIVGAAREDDDVNGQNPIMDAGSVYIFERNTNGNWVQVQKIVASDRASNDRFGGAVSISGNYAIVGAYFEDEDSNGSNTLPEAGSAYIFEKNSFGTWDQVQKIVASDRGAGDNFGITVSISGNYAIVGAYHEDENQTGGNTLADAGSAYIFERGLAGNWNQTQKIVASDRGSNDLFGFSVSISGDYAIVGAYFEDHDEFGLNTMSNSGSAYIFERSGTGIWNQVKKLVSSDREAGDWFGWSVAINGNSAVVGAYHENEDATGGNTLINAGSAYIFERNQQGSWNQTQKIVASDRSSSDLYGKSVSVSGNYIIVGTFADDEDEFGLNFLFEAGSAYLYLRNSNGIWMEIKKIVPLDRGESDSFGNSVSISGNVILIGTNAEDEDVMGLNTLTDAGSAYVFEATGVNSVSDQIDKIFRLFPNPTENSVYLETNYLEKNTEIILTNIFGKELKRIIIDQKISEIDLHGLSSGIYFVQLKSNKGQYQKKIIKL